MKPVWTEQGPGPLSLPEGTYNKAAGAVQAIAIDPLNSDRAFVGTVGGGIWMSIDAISSTDPQWTPQSDLAPSLSMSAIAFSQIDPNRNTLYAGCAQTSHSDPIVGPPGGPLFGLLKTTDGGANWNEIARATFQDRSVWRILPMALTTNQGEVVLAATSGGLFRSEDSGASWAASTAVSAPCTEVAQDPGSQTRVYVGAGGHVWRSEDGGKNDWQDITPAVWSKLPGWTTIRISVSPVADFEGNHWIYASSTGGSIGENNVNFSPDLGATWFPLGKAPDNSTPNAPTAASPIRPDLLFCVTNAGSPNHYMVIVSTTKPAQWTSIENAGAHGTGPHTDARDMVITPDGGVLLECNDGGIYRLRNPHGAPKLSPRKWDEAVGNIRIAEFHSIAYDSINNIIFGATQDNSVPQQTIPDGWSWNFNEDPWGDAFQVGVDTTSTPGSAVHYSSQQNLFQFIRRTYTSPTLPSPAQFVGLVILGTGGLHYNVVEGALTPDDPNDLGTVRWNQTWIVNAVDPTRILLGTDFLYESFDRGDTFSSLGGLAKNKNGEWIPANPVGTVSAYAYGHLFNADVIYVGAGNKIWVRSGPGGLPSALTTYPGSTPFDIVLDPDDWLTAFVLDDQGRVWRTDDAGATAKGWNEITGNLPQLSGDLRTLEVARIFSVGILVFVAGYGGVFVTENQNSGRFTFWRKHGNNFPNAVTTDIHYSAANDVLIAATLGRSSWSLRQLSSTFIGEPTLVLHASPRSSCFGGWVERATYTFKPEIQGVSNLTGPISFRWTVQGGTTTSPLNGNQLLVTMPAAGTEIVVTLTVTDATGYSMYAFFDDYAVTAQVAGWRTFICELLGRIRTELKPNWPIHPLGPDPGPEGIASLPDYSALRRVFEQMVEVTTKLEQADRPPIAKPGLREGR